MRRNSLYLSAVLLFACCASAAVPEWVRAAAKTQVNASAYADDVSAVILISDESVRVQPNGDMVWSMRRAVRILRPQGRDQAMLPVSFDKDSKIISLRAYGINQQGQEFEAKEKDAYEVNLSGGGDLYSDDRNKVIRAPAGDPGSIIAFEVEEKMRPYVHETRWSFQEEQPVLLARYTVSLAPGWEYSNTFLHHAKMDANTSGGDITWQISDVPAIHDEFRMPAVSAVAGSMLIHFFSSGNSGKSNRSWAEVGAWESELAAGRRTPSPEIQETVRQLTATAPDFEAKVRAVTNWMQREIRYVEIKIGIGGFQPHAASAVFHSRYGDCKDKATLLSSMLKEAGIDSEYVLAYYGSRSHVQPDGPSASSFNHAFIAIRLPGNEFKDAPAVVKDKSGQRWLLFDPTDEYLQVGSIEGEMQGSYILLIDHGAGELIQIPLASSDRNYYKRSGKLALAADGSLQGELLDVAAGDYAEGLRGRMLAEKPEDRARSLEHSLSEQLGNIKIEDFSVENLDDCNKELRIHYKLSVASYSKNAGPLLLVRPHVFGLFGAAVDKDQRPRQYAYEFPFVESRSDDFEITMPAGYKVDELPKPVQSDFGFATYTAKAEVKDNLLHYSRSMSVSDPEVPVEKINDVRRLFHAINQDERGTAVFKKAD